MTVKWRSQACYRQKSLELGDSVLIGGLKSAGTSAAPPKIPPFRRPNFHHSPGTRCPFPDMSSPPHNPSQETKFLSSPFNWLTTRISRPAFFEDPLASITAPTNDPSSALASLEHDF